MTYVYRALVHHRPMIKKILIAIYCCRTVIVVGVGLLQLLEARNQVRGRRREGKREEKKK